MTTDDSDRVSKDSYRIADIYKLRYQILQIHNGDVTCIKISPDRKYAATGASDGTVKVWHLSNGRFKTKYMGHKRGISDLVWSPNCKYIATASDDNTIKIWSIELAGCLKTLTGHTYSVTTVKFNYKGNLLVSGSADEAVRIWDVQKGKCLKILSAHSDPIASVDLTWDGTVLASGSYDGLIRLFDVFSGQCLKTLMYDKSDSSFPISHVKFSPNGKYLLSSSLDGVLRLWDYTNNKVIKTYKGYLPQDPDQLFIDEKLDEVIISEKYSCSTQFISATTSPLIVSGSQSGNIMVWNLDTRQIKSVMRTGQNSPVVEVDIADHGAILASVTLNGCAQIWDLVEYGEQQESESEATPSEAM